MVQNSVTKLEKANGTLRHYLTCVKSRVAKPPVALNLRREGEQKRECEIYDGRGVGPWGHEVMKNSGTC